MKIRALKLQNFKKVQDPTEDKSWSFLIASPSHSGDFFEESVILLLQDSEDGAFGIALNKPSGKHLGDISDEFEGLEEIEIFSGGPVNETAIGIAVCAKNNTDELGGKFVFGAAPKDAIAELSKDPDARAAAFMGYCGWGAGQLKKEIEEGAWIVMNADMELVFDTPPEFLWRELVLREMPEFDALPPPETSPDLN